MIKKSVVWCCVGMAIGVGASFFMFKAKVAAIGASNRRLAKQSVAVIGELAKAKVDLAACQGSTQAAEASLEDFYQELIFADRIDVVTFGDDGLPRRLVFDCKGGER